MSLNYLAENDYLNPVIESEIYWKDRKLHTYIYISKERILDFPNMHFNSNVWSKIHDPASGIFLPLAPF